MPRGKSLMKTLKAAIVFKDRKGVEERDRRAVGWWSYPVPEFEWDFFPAVERMALTKFKGFDLVFHEDTCKGQFYERRMGDPPLIYLSIDSTLSEAHYQARLKLAGQADLIMVDHDRLERFKGLKKETQSIASVPVRRLNYCVNDRIFKPGEGEKNIDVVYHCGSGESRGFPGGKERNEIRRFLGELCNREGYSIRSGAVGLEEYAGNMGKAKVVVNWPRTVTNRPHRVFDAMACGAALMTGSLPTVEGDGLEWGKHYLDFEWLEELEINLKAMINESWASFGEAGNELVMVKHTWFTRAQELRMMLHEELGL